MIFVCHIALYVCFVCVRLRLLLPRPVTFGSLSGSKLKVKVEATFSRNGQRIGVKEVTDYGALPGILCCVLGKTLHPLCASLYPLGSS